MSFKEETSSELSQVTLMTIKIIFDSKYKTLYKKCLRLEKKQSQKNVCKMNLINEIVFYWKIKIFYLINLLILKINMLKCRKHVMN